MAVTCGHSQIICYRLHVLDSVYGHYSLVGVIKLVFCLPIMSTVFSHSFCVIPSPDSSNAIGAKLSRGQGGYAETERITLRIVAKAACSPFRGLYGFRRALFGDLFP